MEILKIENLSFSYPQSDEPVLRNVDLSVREGDFVALLGKTGSGKSTLLRSLKKEIAPRGEMSGKIIYMGVDAKELSEIESASFVGFVAQRPEQQIVCDKVWHELAFGLENLGVSKEEIGRRVAEIACYFGIEDIYDKKVSELSGGQKQILNLAAVMVMSPKILILDEPTSQLDPIAATEFYATLKKLNRELSLTIIVTEHRTEELLSACDRLILLDGGRIISDGSVREVAETMSDGENAGLLPSMPLSVRLWHGLGKKGRCPLDISESRAWLRENFSRDITSSVSGVEEKYGKAALTFENVSFRYDKDGKDILSGVSFSVNEGEIYCILGGNGSGKSTTLGVASGVLRAYSGKVSILGKKIKDHKGSELWRGNLSMLPQDVETLFLRNTVFEELEDMGGDIDSLPFELKDLYHKHPYDLSGGEGQLVALAKVLLTQPRVLLLDEPTKALDPVRKREFSSYLKKLKGEGVAVVVVTHDVEFAAECGDRCALFFRGNIVSEGTPDEFFSENNFYTTSARRISRGYYERTVKAETLEYLCRANGQKL